MSKLTKRGNQASYMLGFGLSFILTLAAYIAVVRGTLNRAGLVVLVVALATMQLLIQLVFFLHLDKEAKPRWNLYVFLFMLMVVGIIVAGSLWIMYNLDYNHAGHNHYQTPDQIINDEGVKL